MDRDSIVGELRFEAGGTNHFQSSSDDPEIHEIMEKEKRRQAKGIVLVHRRIFFCRALMDGE